MWQSFTQWMSNWSFFSILVRLLIAWVVGILIGINRERRNRGAGVRTHVLVCIGAALATMTGQYAIVHFAGTNVDVTRMAGQVITGIGFLGAGTILVTRKKQIQGLTTAASLWACACAGLAIGIGFIEGTIITAVLIIITLALLPQFEKKLHQSDRNFELYMEFQSNRDIRNLIRLLHTKRLSFSEFNIIRDDDVGAGPSVTIRITLNRDEDRESVLAQIRDLNGLEYFEVI